MWTPLQVGSTDNETADHAEKEGASILLADITQSYTWYTYVYIPMYIQTYTLFKALIK